jgi:nitrate reductase (cytochrome), electron transfer subunit
MSRRLAAIAALVVSPWLLAAAEPMREVPPITGPIPFTREMSAPPMQRQVTDDVRRRRNYPDQPPLIPHSIEGYQVDLRANRCLACHSRRFTEQSGAPMISVTHYQDRDGNFLGGVAPRRYACLACHVVQTTAKPLIENRFVDIDDIAEPEHRVGDPPARRGR